MYSDFATELYKYTLIDGVHYLPLTFDTSEGKVMSSHDATHNPVSIIVTRVSEPDYSLRWSERCRFDMYYAS